MKVTYEQIDKVLRSHGFTYRTVESARIYEHKPTGALVAIAYLPDSAEVVPAHLAVVTGTLHNYGFADPMDLAVQLHQAGAVVSPPTNGHVAAKRDAEPASSPKGGHRRARHR